jgi:hypothetical protein
VSRILLTPGSRLGEDVSREAASEAQLAEQSYVPTPHRSRLEADGEACFIGRRTNQYRGWCERLESGLCNPTIEVPGGHFIRQDDPGLTARLVKQFVPVR